TIIEKAAFYIDPQHGSTVDKQEAGRLGRLQKSVQKKILSSMSEDSQGTPLDGAEEIDFFLVNVNITLDTLGSVGCLGVQKQSNKLISVSMRQSNKLISVSMRQSRLDLSKQIMDLFSDENGNNVSFLFKDLPVDCASTPKRPRSGPSSVPSQTTDSASQLECQICGKKYILQFYYQKHLKTHLAPSSDVSQVSLDNIDQSSLIQLNDSDLSVINVNKKQKKQTFKVPAVPKAKLSKKTQSNKKKAELICTYCLKKYVCSRSFKAHMRNHSVQAAASQFPDREKILENVSHICSASLTEVANSPSFGPSGAVFKQLIGHVVGLPVEEMTEFSTLICSELISPVCNQKTMLPSPLMTTLFDKMEEIVSDDSLCEKYLSVLHLDYFEPHVQSQFLMEFLLNFTLEIFKFISSTYRSTFTCSRQRNFQLDQEDKQVVFYIAGSIMRGYLKMARRHKENQKWKKIESVLRCKVLCEKPIGEIDAEWTAELDRGGLLYIQQSVQEFFKKVCLVVFACEKRDGSIDYEEVISKVSNCDISVDWDNIIKDSLDEEVSISLMNDVITCFCRTCGRGVAKRRLNFLRQKPVISMATRVSVARRKKT
ncbi:PR domain zinc finger protein 14, partial [Frankliniella fusca]